MAGPLSHIRVLDMTRVLAGPWTGQNLADLGADVIKIERPGKGDDSRAFAPPYIKDEQGNETKESAYFCCANRGKRSVTVDISKPEGAQLVRELAANVDVLLENYKFGDLTRYGLGYEQLKEVNPRLVYCSITGFGQTGPDREKPGYDFMIQGMGGIMSVTGQPDGVPGAEPMKIGVAFADIFTGLYCTIGIQAALYHRERTGEGQQIDISLLDTQIACLANQAMNWLVGGVDPGRLGNRHPTVVPYKTFDVADGTIIIAIGNDGQFRAFCTLMGVPQLAQDARFVTASARLINRDAIEAEVQRLVANEPGLPLIDRLAAAGVPAGPVNKVSEVFADPFITARNVVHDFVRADGAHIPSVAFPGKLSATPATMRRPPPRVGEDEISVIADWLDR